jgi:hypothetical protein
MNSTTTMKKRVTCRESLAGRLAAYSVMAGAALAFMPTADGAIVSPNKNSIAGSPSSICEVALIQSQQVQSQKFRHQRHAGMRVMSTSTCTPTPTPTGGE